MWLSDSNNKLRAGETLYIKQSYCVVVFVLFIGFVYITKILNKARPILFRNSVHPWGGKGMVCLFFQVACIHFCCQHQRNIYVHEPRWHSCYAMLSSVCSKHKLHQWSCHQAADTYTFLAVLQFWILYMSCNPTSKTQHSTVWQKNPVFVLNPSRLLVYGS